MPDYSVLFQKIALLTHVFTSLILLFCIFKRVRRINLGHVQTRGSGAGNEMTHVPTGPDVVFKNSTEMFLIVVVLMELLTAVKCGQHICGDLQFDMLTEDQDQLPGCESLQKLFVSLLGSTQQCRHLIPQRYVLNIQDRNKKMHQTPQF